ncbi:MAG: hypothetical protein DDT30_00848 [Dehalococcoidia bacterium]|nr:hypothetical protein [Bacillota bacterium]MBT9143387.1 hypothetical protein [Bacillota bacterium]
MEARVKFEDQRLDCCDCGKPFIFSAGERAFFWSKGLTQPRRCKECRERRRLTLVQARAGGEG